VVGSRLRFIVDSSNYMEGIATAVSGTSVTATMDFKVGSGTSTAWTITVCGERGTDGIIGADGASPTLIETSTTSNTIATSGSKTWNYTADTHLAWVVGQRLRAINDTTHYMDGTVTSVSSTSVTMTIDNGVGSGTFTSWTLCVSGPKGDTGAAGSNGTNGTNGSNGTSFPAFSYATKTVNYVAVTGDFSGNKLIEMNVASANTFTINSGLTGIEPLAIAQMGAGQTTIVAGSGVTILSSQGFKLRTVDSCATLIPCGTNRYRLSGDTTA
jgi:hypothetical protein